MKKLIGAAFVVLVFAVISIPAHSARVLEEPPKPGYHCQVGRAFEDTAWGSATLDAAGAIQEMNWTWRTPLTNRRFQLLILGGMVSVEGNRIKDSGTAFLQWSMMPDARRTPQKRSVQLTSSPQPRFLWSAFGTGKAEKTWTPGLMIYWPDLLAFAKSAPALNFHLLDDRGKLIAAQTLDKEVFLKAEKEIEATLETFNAKIVNFQTQCEKVDDIINRDIVV